MQNPGSLGESDVVVRRGEGERLDKMRTGKRENQFAPLPQRSRSLELPPISELGRAPQFSFQNLASFSRSDVIAGKGEGENLRNAETGKRVNHISPTPQQPVLLRLQPMAEVVQVPQGPS